jgi:predicted metalloprotease with PDZ domain
MKRLLILLAILTAPALRAANITLSVDATEAPRKIFHAHLVIPSAPGPITLLYPRWIPGEHGPTGPLQNLANVRFSAGGTPLPWNRDPVEMYAFHAVVPDSADHVEVDLDFLAPLEGGAFSAGASATANMALVSWNTLVLFPKGTPADDLTVEASITLPEGWKFATALPVASRTADRVAFKAASLATVIDSPVQIGKYLHQVVLSPSGDLAKNSKQFLLDTPHELDIASESETSLETPKGFEEAYERLVAQSGALFGARHYRDYHWLVSLSDHVEHFGLEHHESSDDRMEENTLSTDATRRLLAGLLSHEFVHSWNGKYRRPAGLLSPDYQKPMEGALLWVYEGLTQYIGYLLPTRAGLWTPEYYRERVAVVAATLDHEAGRTWRPLADTAVEAQVLYGLPHEWWSLRRGTDFYDESILLWLEVDMLIRQQSGGKKSVDDFCRHFHGGEGGAPALKPYTFEDVVAALNDVTPYDWKKHLEGRLSSLSPHAPLGGIEMSGWKLVYDDQPNLGLQDLEGRGKYLDFAFSLGMQLKEDGSVRDVTPGQPAARSGLAPGMKIVAVNGRKYTKERMEAAVRSDAKSTTPIHLIVENTEEYVTFDVDAHEGLRYPHLVRDGSRPDLLSRLLAPLDGK